MASGKQGRKPRKPAEYDAFEELTRRLVHVPKTEIDKAVKDDKERRARKA